MSSALSRRQIAERELDSAIRLLFRFNDSISAYVLAWAAYEIVGAVSRSRGIESVEQEFERSIPASELKDWRIQRRLHYNFFKHADRDPEAAISHIPIEMVEVQIFIANLDYQGAFRTLSPIQSLYMSWFTATYPEFTRPEFEFVQSSLAKMIGFPEGGTRREMADFMVKMLEAFDHMPGFADFLRSIAPLGRP